MLEKYLMLGDLPVEGAVVRLGQQKTITDKNGDYRFNAPPLIEKNGVSLFVKKGNHGRNHKILKWGENHDIRFYPKGTLQYVQKDRKAQSTTLSGMVIDRETEEPLIFASVGLLQNGQLVKGCETDFDGKFNFGEIDPDIYEVEIGYLGYESLKVSDLKVHAKKINELTVRLNAEETILETVAVRAYQIPLIEQDNTTQGKMLTSDEIRRRPTRSINGLAASIPGLVSEKEEGNITIRGSRSNATKYYLDGIRISGRAIPEADKAQINNDISPKSENKKERQTIEKLLEGRVAGVEIGQKRPIKIRGQASIDAKKPLYVIDGIPKGKEEVLDLNSDEISSIHILKNELAQSLYGERAKEGVIMINTNAGNNSEEAIIGRNEIKQMRDKLIKEGQEKATKFQERQLDIAKRLQNGSISPQQNKTYIKELEAMQKAIITLEKQIQLFDGVLKNQEKTTLRIEATDVFKGYNYALNFKEGFYTSRTFYVPKYTVKKRPEIRDDFRNTIYWNPSLVTDEKGKASIEFYNSDAITTFKAIIEGISDQGKIGRGEMTYFTQQPLGMQVKIPTNLLTGDIVQIPVVISNNSGEKLEGELIGINPEGLHQLENVGSKIKLDSKESKTILLKYQVLNIEGKGDLKLIFKTQNGFTDEINKQVKISSRGFPVETIFSGNSMEEKFDFKINNPIDGSVKTTFTVYPSVVDEIITGLDRMLRQPTGCFEQTSSKNYPNLLVLSYLQHIDSNDKKSRHKAMEFLDAGYKRLLGFEVDGGGFDWYGRPPAHEGLTAYGLMQFIDMAKVYQVEPNLIERTANWLLDRRNGNGGWKRSKKGLHRWRGSDEIGDAYIAWAMAEAGYGQKIMPEIEQSIENALTAQDPYLLALMANVVQICNLRQPTLLKKLLSKQNPDGSWNGKTTSMTCSKGKSLTIETTALANVGITQK